MNLFISHSSSSCSLLWEKQTSLAAVVKMHVRIIGGFCLCFLLFWCFYFCPLHSLFLPQTWWIQRTQPDHNRPHQIEPSYWPHPPTLSLEVCIQQHSAVVSFRSHLLCWSDAVTPLGLDKRPRGFPPLEQLSGNASGKRHTGRQVSSYTGVAVESVWNQTKCLKRYEKPWCC